MRVTSNGKIRRDEGEWREIVKRCTGSGMEEESFCAKEKLSLTSFRRWRRKLEGVEGRGEFIELSAVPVERGSEVELRFPTGLVIRIGG